MRYAIILLFAIVIGSLGGFVLGGVVAKKVLATAEDVPFYHWSGVALGALTLSGLATILERFRWRIPRMITGPGVGLLFGLLSLVIFSPSSRDSEMILVGGAVAGLFVAALLPSSKS